MAAYEYWQSTILTSGRRLNQIIIERNGHAELIRHMNEMDAAGWELINGQACYRGEDQWTVMFWRKPRTSA